MPIDPTHWLYRLSPEQWLAAANSELAACSEKLSRRALRPGVTHARRAAGMALNAILTLREDPRFGRSYMDHIVSLAQDDATPADVRAAAQLLRDTPAAPPQLIAIGRPDMTAHDAAARIVAHARTRVAALSTAAS